MSIQYDVPLIAQTKQNICWHAAAEMIWFFWQSKKKARAGPMYTVADKWGGTDFKVEDFARLAKNVGMKPVPFPTSYFTSQMIERLLKKHGPLFAAISVDVHGAPVGHVIVVTGITGDIINLNDPGMGGVKRRATVAWFNQHLSRNVHECLMYKNPKAY